MKKSIKQRTIASTLIAWTIVQLLGSLLLYFHLKGVMYQSFDKDLSEHSISLISMIREIPESGELDMEWLEVETYDPPNYVEGRDYLEVANARTGYVYHKSGSVTGEHLKPQDTPQIYPVYLPDNQVARCISVVFTPAIEKSEIHKAAATDGSNSTHQPKSLVIYLATKDTVLPELSSLKIQLITTWLGGVILGSLIISLVVGRNLKPLDQLKEKIETLDALSLGKRITLDRETTELSAITQAMNALLQRVDDAFQREKVMSSNVAHELRTPVAGLMANLELATKFHHTLENHQETNRQCLKIAEEMHWLVSNLLSMSRIDAGIEQLSPQEISLPNELRMWWRPFARSAAERKLSLHWDIPADLKITTDPRFLSVIMRNIFENTVQYSNPSGKISISLSEDGTLMVSNTVNELESDTVTHCFETFWRKAHVHEGDRHNSGLGLSLCKKIAHFMGIAISATTDPQGSTFSIQISLPLTR